MTEDITKQSKVVAKYLFNKAKEVGCPAQQFAEAIHVAYVSRITSGHVKQCKTCSENPEVFDRLEFLCAVSLQLLSSLLGKSLEGTEQMFNEMFPVMKAMYSD